MIAIHRSDDDDPDFLDQIECLILGCLTEYRPAELYITQIRDFFDRKWCYFTGKILGAIGFAASDLTLPPFVPNRVLSQHHYDRSSESSSRYEKTDAPPLHIDQCSGENFNRFTNRTTNDGTLFWVSSGSAVSGRGSLMVYHVTPEEKFGWHVTFHKKTEWQIEHVTYTSRAEVEALSKSGYNKRLDDTPKGVSA